MEYIKYKLTGALIVAFLFLSACNGEDGSGYWQAIEIIDIYTHKMEKRLDRLGTYLVFIATTLLLILLRNLALWLFIRFPGTRD